MEITENGKVYIIQGDYPNGRYVKHIKDKGVSVPVQTDSEKLTALAERINAIETKLDTINGKVDSVKTSVNDLSTGVK